MNLTEEQKDRKITAALEKIESAKNNMQELAEALNDALVLVDYQANQALKEAFPDIPKAITRDNAVSAKQDVVNLLQSCLSENAAAVENKVTLTV